MPILEHNVNGITIGQRQDDGYINGTAMCAAHGKDISDWLKTDETLALVSALARRLEIEPKTGKSGNSVYTRVSATYPTLVIVKRGSPENGGGTWLHPKLAIQIAQWCNPEFALQVSDWIVEWMTTGQNPISTQPQQPPTRPVLSAYTERLEQAMSIQLKPGYWCVLKESSDVLLYVELKLKLPVDKSDLLDGSIGKLWSSYRADKSWAGDRYKFSYRYPDGRWCNPWAYQRQELGYFREWLQQTYVQIALPVYLKQKYQYILTKSD